LQALHASDKLQQADPYQLVQLLTIAHLVDQKLLLQMKMVALLELHDQLGALEQGQEPGLLVALLKDSLNVHSILLPQCPLMSKSIAELGVEKLMRCQAVHRDQ